MNLSYPQRRSIRLPDYNYAQAGVYFITMCTHQRKWRFGEIIQGTMNLSPDGAIVARDWLALSKFHPHLTLDEFVIMPNHVHGLLVLNEITSATNVSRSSLAEIVRRFKTFSALAINKVHDTAGTPLWQRNYYEHIVRDDESCQAIRTYIQNNPATWTQDSLYGDV